MCESSESPWGALAEMPDVAVRFGELEDGCLGWWDPDKREIVLDKRQSRRQMRCTLAHELEHARRGDEDTCDMSSVLATRQEIAASVRAARRLISLDRLIYVLLWTQNEHEIAEELNVDEETLRIRLLTLTVSEHTIIDCRLQMAERGIA